MSNSKISLCLLKGLADFVATASSVIVGVVIAHLYFLD